MTAVITPTTIPGPRPMPLLGTHGNTLRFFRDPIGYMRMLHRTFGSVAGIVQNTTHWAFAFGPDYNRYLLTNPDIFYANLAFLPSAPDSSLRRLTSGLLSMNTDQHKRHRSLMLPLFQKQQVETYRDDIVAITQALLSHWRIGQHLDIAAAMRFLTLRIVSTVLLGVHADRDVHSVATALHQWIAAYTSVAVHLFPKDLPGTPYRHLLRVSEHLDSTLRAIVAEKRALPANRRDLLALLIQAHDDDGIQLSDDELIGHANLLFIAGHETSANALAWTLLLLAQHPHILHDLRDELDGTLHGSPPSAEQAHQLPFLDRVVKESLRVLPPSTYAERMGSQPFDLGPYHLPKGAYVGFSSFMTHHMPELYTEPKRFNPDRWLSIAPSPYEYLPFGAGPRMCLGAAFAMLEIKIVLAMILQQFNLELAPHATIDYQFRVTLQPRQIPMIVRDQNRRDVPTSIRGTIRALVALP